MSLSVRYRAVLLATVTSAGLTAAGVADACTRFVHHGADDHIATARSRDWRVDPATNLGVLPRGIARRGEAGPNSITWTAEHGSVVATGYDIATTDGMNGKGLAGAPIS